MFSLQPIAPFDNLRAFIETLALAMSISSDVPIDLGKIRMMTCDFGSMLFSADIILTIESLLVLERSHAWH